MEPRELLNNNRQNIRWASVALIAFVTILLRIIPHTPNIAAVGAIAMVSGFYLPGRWHYIVPLLVIGISDAFIGFYDIKVLAAVYISYLVMVWLGSKANRGFSLVGNTVLGSVSFFLITNAAVWAFGTMYAPNLEGLIASYINAILFFRNSLFSDLTFTTSFFIIVELNAIFLPPFSAILKLWGKTIYQKHQ